jgi:hypothetical protein
VIGDPNGTIIFEPDPNRPIDVVTENGPLKAKFNGGADQEIGKLQVLDGEGQPIPNQDIQLKNVGNDFEIKPDSNDPNGTKSIVTLKPDPSTTSQQNSGISSDGNIEFTIIIEKNGEKIAEEKISYSVQGDSPRTSSTGTERASTDDTNSSALDQIGSQLAAGDPISMATGAYFFTGTLIDLGGPLPLEFEFGYGSDSFPNEDGVALPEKFVHNHRALISAGAGADADAFITLGMGRELIFRRTGFGTWLLTGGHQITHTLMETGGHYLLVDPSTNLVRIF